MVEIRKEVFDKTKKEIYEIRRKIAEIHGSHGVSEIILSIYPAKIQLMRELIKVVKNAMEKQRSETTTPNTQRTTHNATTAKIVGLHLEGPFLNPEFQFPMRLL